MADWKTTVKLGDLHAAFKSGSIPITQVAKDLAERLRKSPYAEELEDEIFELENLEEVDEYDDVLAALYDFGDCGHRIWFAP